MSTVMDKVLLIFDRSVAELGYKTRTVEVDSFIPEGQRPTRDEVYRIISKTTPNELVIVEDGLDSPSNPYLKFTLNPNPDPGYFDEGRRTPRAQTVVEVLEEEAQAEEMDGVRDDEMVIANTAESPSRYRDDMRPDKAITKRALEIVFDQRNKGQIGDYTDMQIPEPVSSSTTGRQVKTYEIKFRTGAKSVLRSIGERPTRRKLIGDGGDVAMDELERLNGKTDSYAFHIVEVKRVESPNGKHKVRYIVDVIPV